MTPLAAMLFTVSLVTPVMLLAQMWANHGQLFTTSAFCHCVSPSLNWEEPLAVSEEGAVVLSLH